VAKQAAEEPKACITRRVVPCEGGTTKEYRDDLPTVAR